MQVEPRRLPPAGIEVAFPAPPHPSLLPAAPGSRARSAPAGGVRGDPPRGSPFPVAGDDPSWLRSTSLPEGRGHSELQDPARPRDGVIRTAPNLPSPGAGRIPGENMAVVRGRWRSERVNDPRRAPGPVSFGALRTPSATRAGVLRSPPTRPGLWAGVLRSFRILPGPGPESFSAPEWEGLPRPGGVSALRGCPGPVGQGGFREVRTRPSPAEDRVRAGGASSAGSPLDPGVPLLYLGREERGRPPKWKPR